jgi:hypothetical protein
VLQTWNIYALLTWMKVKLLRWRRQTSHSASPHSLNNPIISNWKLHMFLFSRMLFSKTLFPADTNIPLVPGQVCTWHNPVMDAMLLVVYGPNCNLHLSCVKK